ILAPLGERPELLATLQAFVTHNGSHGAMTRALGVHRNTVRNRLSEIERRICRSLNDPATRASVWLALEATASVSARPRCDRTQDRRPSDMHVSRCHGE